MNLKNLFLKLFLGALLLWPLACTKESEDFRPVSEINLLVSNEKFEKVSGATIAIFENISDYENASQSRIYNKAYKVITSNSEGMATFELQPDRQYYIIVTCFDAKRNIRLTNIGTSALIKPLPKRSRIHLEMILYPENGNVIFYTTMLNKVPIDITISEKVSQKFEKFDLSLVYTATSLPTISSEQVLKIQREPGIYTYYARSKSGCVWIGEFKAENAKTILIDLTQCQTGTVSFFTPAVNDSLFPLSIKLNRDEINGQLNASRQTMNCADEKSNSYTTTLKYGLYTYLIKSASGRCVWTGNFTVTDGDCLIIPIEECSK